MLSAVLLALAACGGSDDATAPTPPATPTPPKITVSDLPTGSYVVSMGDINAPTVGKYYAAADGSRLLVVADAADRATQLFRKAGSDAWVVAPGSNLDVNVTLLRSDATQAATPTLASLAGNYVTLVATGVTASFSVNAAGDITAGSSTCKLSGKLAANTLPGSLKLTLTTVGCGALPASSTGVVTADADYAPARFRLVADSGTLVVDLWAFAE